MFTSSSPARVRFSTCFVFTHRSTCVSSTGLDTLPSVPRWWALRSWRWRRASWARTRTRTTTNETSTGPLFLLPVVSQDLQIFYGAPQSISENIFIRQRKQYFDNKLEMNGNRLPCFRNLRHLALCEMYLVIVALVDWAVCVIYIVTQPAVNWFPSDRKVNTGFEKGFIQPDEFVFPLVSQCESTWWLCRGSGQPANCQSRKSYLCLHTWTIHISEYSCR